MTNLYIGIDPSLTGTGLAAYDPENPGDSRTDVVCSEPANGLEARMLRFDDLRTRIVDWLPEDSLAIAGICIEGYSYGSKGGQAFDRVEFGGILRHHLICDTDYPMVEVPPLTLKLFVCGKGGGKGTDKGGVKLAAYKRWGVEFVDDNETDAYVLARMAACLWGAEAPANDTQRRAMEKLK